MGWVSEAVGRRRVYCCVVVLGVDLDRLRRGGVEWLCLVYVYALTTPLLLLDCGHEEMAVRPGRLALACVSPRW